MKTVRIGQLEIGEGMPKICVPVVGRRKEDIYESAGLIRKCAAQPDMVEFRADWYEDVMDVEKTCRILRDIRMELDGIPVLFTFRTSKEGGEQMFGYKDYSELLCAVADSGCAEAVDVEAFSYSGMDGDTAQLEQLIGTLHSLGCVVIGSNHDFQATPPAEELLRRMKCMQKMGMDIAKIAVMPHNAQDVLELLTATVRASQDETMCPVITMSMSGQGVISRLGGEVFGSAVTFASAGRASAPGQVELDRLKDVLKLIHESGQQ